jgi:hypothetical protein
VPVSGLPHGFPLVVRTVAAYVCVCDDLGMRHCSLFQLLMTVTAFEWLAVCVAGEYVHADEQTNTCACHEACACVRKSDLPHVFPLPMCTMAIWHSACIAGACAHVFEQTDLRMHVGLHV